MFERFTERARHVVVLAQEEARVLAHGRVGTEHVLLGLVREREGIAALVLEELGLDVERVRARVVEVVGAGQEVTSGEVPLAPAANGVLELAVREALALGHNYVGSEHILLAVVGENEGVAARILLDFDASSDRIRTEVIKTLSGLGEGERLASRGGREARPDAAFGTESEPPALGDLSDEELKHLIARLTDRERDVSHERRTLHGKIDVLRAELLHRLTRRHDAT